GGAPAPRSAGGAAGSLDTCKRKAEPVSRRTHLEGGDGQLDVRLVSHGARRGQVRSARQLLPSARRRAGARAAELGGRLGIGNARSFQPLRAGQRAIALQLAGRRLGGSVVRARRNAARGARGLPTERRTRACGSARFHAGYRVLAPAAPWSSSESAGWSGATAAAARDAPGGGSASPLEGRRRYRPRRDCQGLAG